MRHNDTPSIAAGELGMDEMQAGHSARVRQYLERQIDTAGGFLSFETFMDTALYAPGLGYYSAGARKLGRSGDFTTAPEVSRLFGACVARQCADILRALGGGVILELGAGTGRLAADVLARLQSLEQLPREYLILEISADLRERQRRLIEEQVPGLAHRVRWVDAPPSLDFEGVVLANEVLDALPVARFRWAPTGVEELGVVRAGDTFGWALRDADATMSDACRALERDGGGWEAGYVSEYCPRLIDWARTVTRPLRRGAALWFDYGLPRAQYYLPERDSGTLICHFRHRAHDDPLVNVGVQDISAWVDFTRLAEATRGTRFTLAGFTTQAHFLAGCGIDDEMRRFAGEDARAQARCAAEARQLLLPGEMGERFKAMAWLAGLELDLRGFALRDLSHSLG